MKTILKKSKQTKPILIYTFKEIDSTDYIAVICKTDTEVQYIFENDPETVYTEKIIIHNGREAFVPIDGNLWYIDEFKEVREAI